MYTCTFASVGLSRVEQYLHHNEPKPPSTFAIAATDALLAALLIAHGVVATLCAEVASNAIGRQHHGVKARQMTAAIVQPIAIPVAPMTAIRRRLIRCVCGSRWRLCLR